MEKLPQKLKFIRSAKNWTQEEIAEKLGISIHAYAKIEGGETNVSLSRLEQIAEVMEIELSQLFGLDEKNVISGDNNTPCQNVNYPSTELIECKHELEKANLIIEEQGMEINYLKQQVNDLIEINHLLKKSP
jgi:transcriptional regulator with XRE-family HTH domain